MNAFSGTIPTEIGLISSCAYVRFLIPLSLVHTQLCSYYFILRSLLYNTLSGTIPTEIGLLSSLTYLCDTSFSFLSLDSATIVSFSGMLEVCQITSSLEPFPLNFISLHCLLLDTFLSPPILCATTPTTLLGQELMTSPRRPFVWLSIAHPTTVPIAPPACAQLMGPVHQVQVVMAFVLVYLATTERVVIPVFRGLAGCRDGLARSGRVPTRTPGALLWRAAGRSPQGGEPTCHRMEHLGPWTGR